MALSMKFGLVAILAITMISGVGHAQSTDTQDPSADSSDTDPGPLPGVDPALAQSSPDGTPYQYGVFREVAAAATAVNQRNCWVQGLVNGQTINGDLLTERVSLTQAQCVLNYLTRRGLCANQRTTNYWSARRDETSNDGSNNVNNSSGSNNWQNNNGQNNNWQNNNWQNNNGSQGGGTAQGGGTSQNGGGGHHHRRGRNGGDSQDSGDGQNGSQWTRQGEWMQNGGVNPAWMNSICSGNGTASGSTGGPGGGTGSGTGSN